MMCFTEKCVRLLPWSLLSSMVVVECWAVLAIPMMSYNSGSGMAKCGTSNDITLGKAIIINVNNESRCFFYLFKLLNMAVIWPFMEKKDGWGWIGKTSFHQHTQAHSGQDVMLTSTSFHSPQHFLFCSAGRLCWVCRERKCHNTHT